MFKTEKKDGKGIVNSLINNLPFELHIPGFQFCGPGTKLNKRLLRGDKGINLLDKACRKHDISYSLSNNLNDRHKADKILLEEALERAKSNDSNIGEKLAAIGVAGAMKLKTKTGMGIKKRKNKVKKVKTRQLPIPKVGGFLPIAALGILSALGSVAGGAAGIVKTVNAISSNAKKLEELKRHNKVLEGKGLFLSPYKKGKGLKKKKKKRNIKKKKNIFF